VISNPGEVKLAREVVELASAWKPVLDPPQTIAPSPTAVQREVTCILSAIAAAEQASALPTLPRCLDGGVSGGLKRRLVELRADESAQHPPRRRPVGEDGLVRVRCQGCRRPLGDILAGERRELRCKRCGAVTSVQA
jgi:hypothetical protein